MKTSLFTIVISLLIVTSLVAYPLRNGIACKGSACCACNGDADKSPGESIPDMDDFSGIPRVHVSEPVIEFLHNSGSHDMVDKCCGNCSEDLGSADLSEEVIVNGSEIDDVVFVPLDRLIDCDPDFVRFSYILTIFCPANGPPLVGTSRLNC